jgi:hypothetical protein
MGNIRNNDGSLTIQSTPPQTVTDMQALADRIEEAGGVLKLSSAERTSLTSGQVKQGWIISETDTQSLYLVQPGYPQGRLFYQDWRSYTPTSTGASGGTLTGQYRVIGGSVECRIRHVLGGAGVTAQPIYSLPLPAVDASVEWFPGIGLLRDSSAGAEVLSVARKNSATVVAPYCLSTATPYSQYSNVAPTVPFAWAAGDVIALHFSYVRAE